ncbi:MAG: hypothetical protein QOF55_444, partial [Thermoleophilaceae bacterium]|nr:hypothetical protein [Thermoleophilaceae bacterium]
MGRWRNWARDQVCTPAERVEPRSEEALIEAVTRAPGRVR